MNYQLNALSKISKNLIFCIKNKRPFTIDKTILTTFNLVLFTKFP